MSVKIKRRRFKRSYRELGYETGRTGHTLMHGYNCKDKCSKCTAYWIGAVEGLLARRREKLTETVP